MRARSILIRIIRSDVTVVVGAVFIISFALSQISTGFTSDYNLSSLSRTIAVTMLVGFAQLFVLSIGHFNLALGPMGAMGGKSVWYGTPSPGGFLFTARACTSEFGSSANGWEGPAGR